MTGDILFKLVFFIYGFNVYIKYLFSVYWYSFKKNWVTDGPWFCWEGNIHCCMGCCCVIVHGIARFLHTEVANCWWFGHSIAHSCWSGGTPLFLLYCLLYTSWICFSPHIHCMLWITINFVRASLLGVQPVAIVNQMNFVREITKLFNAFVYSHSDFILVINPDIYELPVKHNDPRNSAIYIEWVDSNKDWRIWGFWHCWGLYLP